MVRNLLETLSIGIPNIYMRNARTFIYIQDGKARYTVQYTAQNRKRIDYDFGFEIKSIWTKIQNKKQKLPYTRYYYLHFNNDVNTSSPSILLHVGKDEQLSLYLYDESREMNCGHCFYKVLISDYMEIQRKKYIESQLQPKLKEEQRTSKRTSKIRTHYIELIDYLRDTHAVNIIRPTTVPFKLAIPCLQELVKTMDILAIETKDIIKPKVINITLENRPLQLFSNTLGATLLLKGATIEQYIESVSIKLNVNPRFLDTCGITLYHEYGHILWYLTYLRHGDTYRRIESKKHVQDAAFKNKPYSKLVPDVFNTEDKLYPTTLKTDIRYRTEYIFSMEELMARNFAHYMCKKYLNSAWFEKFLQTHENFPIVSDAECLRFHKILMGSLAKD